MVYEINPIQTLENLHNKTLDETTQNHSRLLAILFETYPNKTEFIAGSKAYKIIVDNKKIKIKLTTSLFKISSEKKTPHYYTYTPCEQGGEAKTLKSLRCKVKHDEDDKPRLHILGEKRNQLFKIVKAVVKNGQTTKNVANLKREEQMYSVIRPEKKGNLVKDKYSLFSTSGEVSKLKTIIFTQDYINGIDGSELIINQNKRSSIDEKKCLINKPLITMLKYLNSVLKDLKKLHDINLLHGDIKPANIIFTQSEEAFLIDFGFTLPANEGELRGSNYWIAKDALYHGLSEPNEIAILAMSMLYVYADYTKLFKTVEIILKNGQEWSYLVLKTEALDAVLIENPSSEREQMHNLLKAMVDDDPEKRPDVDQCITETENIITMLQQRQQNHNINKLGLFSLPADNENPSTLNSKSVKTTRGNCCFLM